jgi:hypothetical protein
MAQNQNPGQGTPMGPQRNMGDIASMLSSMGGRPGGGMPPGATALGGPPQGAPGQGPGGAKGGMQKQIAGLQGGPPLGGAVGGATPPMPPGGAMQPLSGPNPAMAANLAQWAAQRGPKNPNAPQPNFSTMPGMTQGPMSLGMGRPMPQQGMAPGQASGALQQGRRMMGQGAPGQGAGGNKNQQMATLPGGPR